MKRCIISVAIGEDYKRRLARLKKTLDEHKFDGDFITWTEFPNNNYDTYVYHYNFKAAAFEEVLKLGYTEILWIDSSYELKKCIDPIFDLVTKHGYLTVRNWGYKCSNTCSDKSLEFYNIDRNTADSFPEHTASFIGIDYSHPNGKKLLDMFIDGCKKGVTQGSRNHDNQSSDPRFLFHRQDQSVLSLSANILKLDTITDWDSIFSYRNSTNNTILALMR
jgi:hypothetical protein